MKKIPNIPIPVIKILRKLGQDISDARRRRRVTLELMAERADLSRSTLSKIEKGDPSTSLGGYAVVLFILGMEHRLRDLADSTHDLIGLRLADGLLPQRVRIPRKKVDS